MDIGVADARMNEAEALADGALIPEFEYDEFARPFLMGMSEVLLRGRIARIDIARNRVAHIASHARFRADNPLFSSLQLATGALYVHQMEGLDAMPPLIVLAACDSAAVAATGTDFTGFLSVLLGMGTRTVVAATTAVPDVEETGRLMVAFHTELSQGVRPADALARARRAVARSDMGFLAAHTFQCFGWG